jgi:hypothetical protein
VATILLDAGMPLDQVQKFLRHKRITTTQIYAETSLHGMSEELHPGSRRKGLAPRSFRTGVVSEWSVIHARSVS